MWQPSKMVIIVEETTPEGGVPIEHDMIEELKIHSDTIEDLAKDLKEQPVKALFWGGLAIQEARRFNKFEAIDFKKWKSYCSRYARLVMKARKEKETIDALEGVVAEVFSKVVMENEEMKLKYAEKAMEQELGESSIKSLKLGNKFDARLKEYAETMYAYEKSFEDTMGMFYEMKADRDMFNMVAEVFKARGYELAGIKDITVGLEGEGFQVANKTVEALNHVATALKNMSNNK
jgi:hypothetical protein